MSIWVPLCAGLLFGISGALLGWWTTREPHPSDRSRTRESPVMPSGVSTNLITNAPSRTSTDVGE